MKDGSSLCPATLRSGKYCRYKGKSEYKGFCGIHARKYLVSKSENRDERLTLLVWAGAALIEISIRAQEYLPKLVEIVISSQYVGFIEPGPGTSAFDGTTKQLGRIENMSVNQPITQLTSPKAIPYNLASCLSSRDWKNLANHLSYDFDVLMESGNLPDELLREVKSRRGKFQALLAASGIEPDMHTADHPTVSRIIEQ